MSLFTGATLIGVALASGGATAYAANKSANASKDASDAALKGTTEGLDFLKAQKAKQEAAAAPYLALGQQATGMLPGMVRPSPQGGPPLPYTTQSQATRPSMPMSGFSAPQAPQVPQSASPAAASTNLSGMAGGMVTIQAPDGSQRQVPANQAQFYVSRGGKVIG